MEKPLLIEQHGAVAEITLNRPQVLNALNDAMRAAILTALPQFPRDPDVYAVVLRAVGPRAFCAGGDVRELCALAKQDVALADASLANEYRLNWTLECFSKPTVSLIDGMVMGSGVGLVLYNTHRVGGVGFRFAMPETAIGLFPDVGACSVLARLPHQIGRYLGLTGRSISRRPALRLGLLTHCIDADRFNDIRSGLAAADPADPLLDGLHEAMESSLAGETDELAGCETLIEDVFSAPSVGAILADLEQRGKRSGANAEWCARVHEELRARAPLSLLVTLRHLDDCVDFDLRQVLIQDYRLATKFLRDDDFAEGVRAILIDKDGRPRWRHARVEDVEGADIARYFSVSADREPSLPDRTEMQAMRI